MRKRPLGKFFHHQTAYVRQMNLRTCYDPKISARLKASRIIIFRISFNKNSREPQFPCFCKSIFNQIP